jgi:spermidine/putrescine transport system permease protein
MRWSGWLLASPAIFFMLMCFVFPSIFLVIYSFWKAAAFQIQPAFEFNNYIRALTQPLFWRVTWNAVLIGVVGATIALTLSLPAGYYMVYVNRSKTIEHLILVTWFSSYLVRIYAWRTLLGTNGVLNTILLKLGIVDTPVEALLYSRFAVGVTLVHLYLPFCILLVATAFREVKPELIDASRDLGRSPVAAFFSVVVPNASNGLVGAFMLTLILIMGDYVTPQMLGGSDGQTTGLIIADQFKKTGNWPLGAAQAVICFLIVVLIFLLVTMVGRISGFIPPNRKTARKGV